MELSQTQIENKTQNLIRLKGRTAEIDNPYYTRLAKGTRIQIASYLPDKDVFKVVMYDGTGNYEYCLRDEFNLIDKEFSGHSIVKKGIRTERKDKFGDRFMLELQNNKRDIYLSMALSSLLNLNQEENYVGFATDPETGIMYIFAADKVSGYEFDKSNNRITSVADWREMQKVYETMNFEVGARPIIDNNNPGFIFYTVTPNYQYFKEESSQKNKVKKVNLEEAVNTAQQYYDNIHNQPTTKTRRGGGITDRIIKAQTGNHKKPAWMDEDMEVYEPPLTNEDINVLYTDKPLTTNEIATGISEIKTTDRISFDYTNPFQQKWTSTEDLVIKARESLLENLRKNRDLNEKEEDKKYS